MIQQLIHRFEEGAGIRYLRYVLLGLFGAGLILSYNLRGFKNMSNPEAMDTAQLARNIALHKGYTTLFIRPFSLFLVQRANTEKYGPAPLGDASDRSMIRTMHPDLANPPVYPLLLAGLMKLQPKFQYQLAGSQHFWNRRGNFWMYEPDFLIGLFNQVLFFIAVGVVFFFALRLFDPRVAWTAAGIFLGTDLFWRFSISGLSTMLLILIFLALCGALMVLEKLGREAEANASQFILVGLAGAIGVVLGIGCLTRYSFGFLILPVLFFLILFLNRHRVILCLTVLAAFVVIISPWMYRNYRISHTPFGVAGYAIYENTADLPGNRLERSLNPDISRVHYDQIWYKFVGNLQACLQDDLPRLGGSWISAFFLVGLLLPYKNPSLNRLRHFLLLCLPVLLVVQSVCRTVLSEDNPVINSENLFVLIAPMVIIYGISLFYILLDQIHLPARQFRYLIITVFCLILCLPALLSFISPRNKAVAYPPYYPPDIQKVSGWMKENELMMSDIPWAVAWYGQRQCMWLTLNAQTDFFNVYDYQKPVKALFLTPVTMDAHFLSDWVKVENSWGSFVFDGFVRHELPPYFPLKRAPAGFLPDELFVTDVDRWSKPKASAAIPSE
jgi:hypothetical protein